MSVVARIVIRFQSTLELQLGIVRAGDDLLGQMHDALTQMLTAGLEDEHEAWRERETMSRTSTWQRVRHEPGTSRSLTGGFFSLPAAAATAAAASSSRQADQVVSKCTCLDGEDGRSTFFARR